MLSKKVIRGIIPVIVLLSLIFVGFNFVSAAGLESYEDELRQIQNEERDNMRKLSGVERELAEYSYDIVTLDINMNDNTKKLIDLQEKINESNKKIDEYENSLNDTSSLYSSTQEKYNEQLRYIYENGLPNIVEILINSKGFSDFIRKMKVY